MGEIRCALFKLAVLSKGSTVFPVFTSSPGENGFSNYLFWDNVKGDWAVGSSNIIIGSNNNKLNNKLNIISIGTLSGNINQSTIAIAIGYKSGYRNQGEASIAVGFCAGQTGQKNNAIAIGLNTAAYYQNPNALAIGINAGYYQQGTGAISIGYNAGLYQQSSDAISIGTNAGLVNQSSNSVAIGQNSGQTNQNSYTVSIGSTNGQTGQMSGSTIINADSTANMSASGQTNGTFINPIRGPLMSSNVLSYDTTTKEIYFSGSSRRYKYDITPLTTNTENVYKLEPREFKYNASGIMDIGLIAEEANECDTWFAYKDKDGIPEGIQWNVITTYLIAELKKLKIRKTQLRKELEQIAQ
jgi:hypothetical protein